MTRYCWSDARLSAAAFGVLAAASGAACGPCTEVNFCDSPARLSYTVEMIDHSTGRPVGGVRVRFVRTSGIALSRDTVDGISGADGLLLLSATSSKVGAVNGDVTVVPPAPGAAYQVPGQVWQVVSGYGDGGILGRWVVAPYIDFVGEVGNYEAGTFIAGARVTFLRASGLRTTIDTLTAVTDPSGRFFFRVPLTPGAGSGTVVGDLIVESASLPRVIRFTNVSLPTTYVDRTPLLGGKFDVGPLLTSATDRATGYSSRVPRVR